MAESVLLTVLSEYTTRKNYLNLEITNLEDQKTLLALSQGDKQELMSVGKRECRSTWKSEFENNEEYYKDLGYNDYTDIPDFEDQIDRITAALQKEIDELNTKEGNIDKQITTDDTEVKEIEGFIQSYKEMLSSNVSEDFNYGSS